MVFGGGALKVLNSNKSPCCFRRSKFACVKHFHLFNCFFDQVSERDLVPLNKVLRLWNKLLHTLKMLRVKEGSDCFFAIKSLGEATGLMIGGLNGRMNEG